MSAENSLNKILTLLFFQLVLKKTSFLNITMPKIL